MSQNCHVKSNWCSLATQHTIHIKLYLYTKEWRVIITWSSLSSAVAAASTRWNCCRCFCTTFYLLQSTQCYKIISLRYIPLSETAQSRDPFPDVEVYKQAMYDLVVKSTKRSIWSPEDISISETSLQVPVIQVYKFCYNSLKVFQLWIWQIIWTHTHSHNVWIL